MKKKINNDEQWGGVEKCGQCDRHVYFDEP